ncbi:aromatic alcohol reductase [Enterobacter sp. 10-1]|uniref:aromatic alcohol reductase n=1 Tax=Raoultella sp. 10-1 TaxID=2683201 RepID=UPI000BA367FD|nr:MULTISPECIES: aromatic alcohol reductase [Enterobacteriaceae]MVT05132.1 aromatic alcohol reductase [Raoultella sp. 10-1]PAC09129.1 aromatic alcohol reductase [Enterobacter sp. 10-1]
MQDRKLTSPENVLVLGAGQLGDAILSALVPAVAQLHGSVTVIVSPESWDAEGHLRSAGHQKHAAAGAKFIPLDMAGAAAESLRETFKRYDTIINCMGFVAGPGTQVKITKAALAAEVKRYFPWQFGVNYDVVGKGSGQPVWDEQYDVRSLLRAQNATEWVIVSTGMFTSFLFEPAFNVVNLAEKTINALGSWDTRVTVTSPADIGRLTTAIYLHQPRIKNEVVFVAGDTISYGQLASTVERVTEQTFRKSVLTLPALLDELRADPDEQMLRYRTAFARGAGMWWPMSETFNARNNISTQNVEDWLKAFI